MKTKLLFLFFIFNTCLAVYAQPRFQEKRIYLLDVTASMEGNGTFDTENIFDMVKESLSATVSNIEDPATEIEIIPFTSNVFEPISGYAAQKDSLISLIRSIGVQRGDTNIADAWSYGVSQIDTTKINYMFLLTDGIHNNGPSKQILYDRLNDWISFSADKYMFGFYVMLVENAREAVIREIADKDPYDNLQSILGMDIDAALIRTSLKHKKNLYESNSVQLSFKNNNRRVKIGDVGIDIEMEENPYYKIEKVKKSIFDDNYSFKIIEKVSKVDIPYNVNVTIYISHDREKYPFVFMTPSVITMDIYNHGPSIVNISDKKFGGRLNNVNFGKVKFKEPFRGPFKKFRKFYEPTLDYIPFKWCIKRDTVTLHKNLYLSYNEETVRSEGEIYIYPTEPQKLDGEYLVVKSEEVVEVDEGLILPFSVKVLPGSKSTTFGGDFFAYTTGIDKINKVDVMEEIQSFCTWSVTYKQKWTLILWLLWIAFTLVVAALIIALGVGGVYLLLKLFGIVGRGTSSVPNVGMRGVPSLGGFRAKDSASMGYASDRENVKILDPDYRIPNGNTYNNPENKTIKELGEDIGDPNPAVRYDAEGDPIFDRDPMAPEGVPMECVFENGIGEYLNKEEIVRKQGHNITRTKLHNEAFRRIAKKYGLTQDELQVFKGNSASVPALMKRWSCSEQEVWIRCKNPHKAQRVLHECKDGKTVQLVARLYHNPLIQHSGGIERVCSEVLGRSK